MVGGLILKQAFGSARFWVPNLWEDGKNSGVEQMTFQSLLHFPMNFEVSKPQKRKLQLVTGQIKDKCSSEPFMGCWDEESSQWWLRSPIVWSAPHPSKKKPNLARFFRISVGLNIPCWTKATVWESYWKISAKTHSCKMISFWLLWTKDAGWTFSPRNEQKMERRSAQC